MGISWLTCSCDKHPGNPGGTCGNSYPFFGHVGWGEPYSRSRICPDCDGCSNRRGLEILSPEKHDVSSWVNSDGPTLQLGKFSSVSDNCSYTMKHRLPACFRRTLNQVISGIRSTEDHLFPFDSEVGTHFSLNPNSRRIEIISGHYSPLETLMVLDPDVLADQINLQNVDCPICGKQLQLMIHGGWIRHPSVGYDSTPRPFSVCYLSCNPDWQAGEHLPNNPVASNAGERPFNDHPRIQRPWMSFWSSKPEYPEK